MLDPARARPAGPVVVLGGGIAGLAAASHLRGAGWQVLVIERNAQSGGMHRARHIGPYTFDIGPIFYEEDARLFGLAPGLRELCPTVMRQQRRIAPGGAVRHYPFAPRESLGLPLPELARAMLDLAWSRLTVRRDGTLDAISRRHLGRRFFENTGLSSYITRFHHTAPGRIDEAFFFHRMAFVERFTRPGTLARLALRTLLPGRPESRPGRPPLRVRPREGFAPLFERITAHLAAQGVEFRFGEALLALRREGPGFMVHTTSGTWCAEELVSTIPLDTLHRAMFGTGSGLVSLDMTSLFLSARRLDPRLGNVLYNFDRRGEWKRATIYSRIYPEPATGREFLSVEATIAQGGTHDPQKTFADFRRHMEDLGLAEDLALEGHEHVASCYPLYTPGSHAVIGQRLRRIAQSGVVLAGRQGRFEYLPTSSRVIERVIEELDKAAPVAVLADMTPR